MLSNNNLVALFFLTGTKKILYYIERLQTTKLTKKRQSSEIHIVYQKKAWTVCAVIYNQILTIVQENTYETLWKLDTNIDTVTDPCQGEQNKSLFLYFLSNTNYIF